MRACSSRTRSLSHASSDSWMKTIGASTRCWGGRCFSIGSRDRDLDLRAPQLRGRHGRGVRVGAENDLAGLDPAGHATRGIRRDLDARAVHAEEAALAALLEP